MDELHSQVWASSSDHVIAIMGHSDDSQIARSSLSDYPWGDPGPRPLTPEKYALIFAHQALHGAHRFFVAPPPGQNQRIRPFCHKIELLSPPNPAASKMRGK